MALVRDLTLVMALLAGTLGLSQVPLFVQQYEQRLGGALQEVQRQLAEFQGIAARENVTLDDLVERFSANQDQAIQQIALSIERSRARAANLIQQAEMLASADRLTKPFVLVRVHDQTLLQATWQKFHMTMTLDAVFGGIGALLAWMINGGCWSLAGAMRRNRRANSRPVRRRSVR